MLEVGRGKFSAFSYQRDLDKMGVRSKGMELSGI